MAHASQVLAALLMMELADPATGVLVELVIQVFVAGQTVQASVAVAANDTKLA